MSESLEQALQEAQARNHEARRVKDALNEERAAAIQRAEKAERERDALEVAATEIEADRDTYERERDEARAEIARLQKLVWAAHPDEPYAQLDQARALLRETLEDPIAVPRMALEKRILAFLSIPNPTEGT